MFFKTRLILVAVFASFLIVAVFITSGMSVYFVEETRFLMGTAVSIKVPVSAPGGAENVKRAVSEAFKEISRVESVFSIYRKDSEISRINGLKAGDEMRISEETYHLIEKCLRYNKITKGAFDITVGPLIILWSEAGKTGVLPTDDEIRSALKRIGSDYVELDAARSSIRLEKDSMMINLGGVAKGYAVDRAVSELRKNGIKNAIVNCGGDMYCLGERSAGRWWISGIQHPRHRDKLFFKIRLKNKAIDTSGDYERFYTLNGRRYSHIIDPRTGHPVGDDVVSASVIAGDSVTADILATSLCVLGTGGLDIVNIEDGQDAVIIRKRCDSFLSDMTPGIMDRYDFVR